MARPKRDRTGKVGYAALRPTVEWLCHWVTGATAGTGSAAEARSRRGGAAAIRPTVQHARADSLPKRRTTGAFSASLRELFHRLAPARQRLGLTRGSAGGGSTGR